MTQLRLALFLSSFEESVPALPQLTVTKRVPLWYPLAMPNQERVDPVERAALWLATTQDLQNFAARIIEEGARPEDFRQAPGRRAATLLVAILIRAARPPFRMPDSAMLGRSELWDIG